MQFGKRAWTLLSLFVIAPTILAACTTPAAAPAAATQNATVTAEATEAPVASSSSVSESTQTIGGVTLPTSTGKPTVQEAEQIAQAAYVFGFPLVVLHNTEGQLSNVPAAEQFQAPINQFTTPNQPLTPSFTTIPAPPVDVLFSNAWLDLSKEPLVFTMPDTGGIYNMMTILDGWTNVIAAPGSRTTGTGGGNFVLVGPNWQGTIPDGLTRIDMPTNAGWIEGSTGYDGPSSLAAVNAVQAGYKLTPLSAWGTDYTPPSDAPVDPNVDTSSTPQNQVQHMTAEAFFSQLAVLMGPNPPSADDAPVLAQMARIGIVPGQPFNWDALSPELQDAVTVGVKHGQADVTKLGLEIPGSTKMNGWLVNLESGWGNYGTDYALRAAAAYSALGVVLPQDDTYYVVGGDGKYNYTITFPEGQTPPTNAFWGIDMYDDHLHLVSNPINRYAIGPHLAPVNYNADGSLTIYIQNEEPSTSAEQQNWLPAPAGVFLLVMHVYWPQESLLNGTWSPPPLTKTN